MSFPEFLLVYVLPFLAGGLCVQLVARWAVKRWDRRDPK